MCATTDACMHICVSAYIHTCILTYSHIQTDRRTDTNRTGQTDKQYVRMYVCVCVSICVYLFIYIYICVCLGQLRSPPSLVKTPIEPVEACQGPSDSKPET